MADPGPARRTAARHPMGRLRDFVPLPPRSVRCWRPGFCAKTCRAGWPRAGAARQQGCRLRHQLALRRPITRRPHPGRDARRQLLPKALIQDVITAAPPGADIVTALRRYARSGTRGTRGPRRRGDSSTTSRTCERCGARTARSKAWSPSCSRSGWARPQPARGAIPGPERSAGLSGSARTCATD